MVNSLTLIMLLDSAETNRLVFLVISMKNRNRFWNSAGVSAHRQ